MIRFRFGVLLTLFCSLSLAQVGLALEPPSGVPASLLAPKQGELLDKARKPLDKIIQSISRPDYLPRTTASLQTNAKRIDQRIAELKKTLAADPADRKAATDLVDLLVVEKNTPADAVPFAKQSDNFLARKHIPLIAAGIDELEDTQMWDIANWYVRLAVSAKDRARIQMNERAAEYYRAYLKVHADADVDRASVIDALQKVDARLIQLKQDDKKKQGGEVSFSVQRHYASARAAWREGRPHEAIQRLRLANNLAPNQPHLLRLLGRIYFSDIRNAEQGAFYLKQAVRADPTDLESVFLLGRYEFLSMRKWADVIAIMAYAQSLPTEGVDKAIPVLIEHYLARALEREGYDHAAIKQYEQLLSTPPNAGAGSVRFFQEIALFARTRPISWQQVGDAYNRLGEPAAAMTAYGEAAKLRPEIELSVAARLVYSMLLSNDKAKATALVLDVVQQTGGKRASLTLLQYLVDHGVKIESLSKQLIGVYEKLGRPATLAIALAKLRGGEKGLATLQHHLDAKPADREVFQRYLELASLRDEKTDLSPAIRLTAQLITKLPAASDRYGKILLTESGRPAEVAKAIAGLKRKADLAPALALLAAMALEQAGDIDGALKAYRLAVKLNPKLAGPRVGLAKLLIGQNQHTEADKLLDDAPAEIAEAVLPLRVQLLREAGKIDQAMVLVERLMREGKSTVSMVLEKGKLQVIKKDLTGAKQTLEDGIDANPTSVMLFEALFELFDQHTMPDADREIARLTARAVRQIPRSAIARSKRAEQLMRAREFAAAERLLRAILDDEATDRRSMELLLFLMTITDRQAMADQFIDQKLKQFPHNRDVLESAVIHYRRTSNRNRLFEVLEQYAKTALTGIVQTYELAQIYIESDRAEKAVELLVEALKTPADIEEPVAVVRLLAMAISRAELSKKDADKTFAGVVETYPKHWADMMFEWAMHRERTGDKENAEKLLEKIIAKETDHARSNNALGYSWADQGIRLRRAEKMIASALKDDPKSSAYLDSMGWVKYKLGDFNDAVRWLEKSRVEDGGDHAVILDHLGDALYRAGRQVEALHWWMKAQSNMDPEDAKVDPELKSLTVKLQQKIGAVRTAKEPKLADSPGPPKDEKDAN